jgi:DNA ligase (NAD+)
MDISGLGEKIVDQLVEEKIIEDISSLYRIKEKKDKILSLEGWQEKSFNNLLESLENSKKAPLDRLINALGIPNVGASTALTLASHFGSMKSLMKANMEQLLEIEDIGPIVAESIISFLNQEGTKKLIDDLERYGFLCLKEEQKKEPIKDNLFLNKEVVITGSLKSYTREEAFEMVKRMGGKVSSNVGKKTDYLVVGEKPGSKLKKAKELNIEIIEGERFEEEIKRWLAS